MHLRSSGALLGAERVVLGLARHSCRFGYDPIVVSLQDPGDPVPEMSVLAERLGLESVVLRCGRGIDRTLLTRLRALLQTRGIDIVHAHGYKEDIHLALARPRAVMLATNHLWKRTDLRLRLYARADAFALRFFDHVVAVSQPIASDMQRSGLRPQRLSCIANGIDTEEFTTPLTPEARRAVRDEFGLRADHIVVLSVSSLTEEKGHVHLLRALPDLCRQVPGLRYLVVGDGPALQPLQTEVAALDLGAHVVFAGRRSDIAALAKAADIFAMPSLIEGLPIALLEAMAAGLPAVASATGDIPTVVDSGRSGTLCTPGSGAELAEAVRVYAVDPTLRARHGSCGQETVCRSFSSIGMTKSYCALYDRLLRAS